jgi:adenylate cyclase
MKPVIARTLRGLGLGCTVWLLVWLLSFTPPLKQFDMAMLDLWTRLFATAKQAHPGIGIIDIDNESISALTPTLGRWPWRDRRVYADLVNFLASQSAKAIALDILFIDPDLSLPHRDRALADAARRAGNVYTAMVFTDESQVQETTPQARVSMVRREALLPSFALDHLPAPAIGGWVSTLLPLEGLLRGVSGVGNTTFTPDDDGVLRRVPLVYEYRGKHYPSLPLAVALGAGLGSDAVRRLPLDPSGRMLLRWHGAIRDRSGARPYEAHQFWKVHEAARAVREGRPSPIPKAAFADKIILVGATLTGAFEFRNTPVSPTLPAVWILATMLDNLLQGNPIKILPPWSFGLLGMAVAGIAAVVVLLARSLWPGALFTLAAASGSAGLSAWRFWAWNEWLPIVVPFFSVSASFMTATAYRGLLQARRERQIKSMFAKYVSPSVMEEALREPARFRVGGQRKELTILFSDIRGFTTLAEKLPPAELEAQLNQILSAMSEVIFQHRGTVDKYIGDGIMAFWGAPIPSDRHALDAARAALSMRDTLEQLNATWEREGRSRLHIGIGVATGEVFVGHIGSERRVDYTVIGDTVNLSSRLEGLNKEYRTTIIISESTWRAIEPLARVRSLGEATVKGKTQPVRIYELLGMAGCR